MAWDIYGNHLHPGNCEVHPYIGEEYPCYVCRQQDDNLRQEREHLRQHHEQQEREYYQAMCVEYCEANSWQYRLIKKLLRLLLRLTVWLEIKKQIIEKKAPF